MSKPPPDSSLDLPRIRLTTVQDHSAKDDGGFLRLRRRNLKLRYPDGSESAPFAYDNVDRRALDAVVMAAHFHRDGQDHVYLRSAVRPPLSFRPRDPTDAGLWELPAGLIEPDEESESGIVLAAKRELAEELGFDVEASALSLLGPSTFPAPAVLGERHYFFEVRVDPSTRRDPGLDGSALEHGGRVTCLLLSEALDRCRHGQFPDAKTELGLRRLSDKLR